MKGGEEDTTSRKMEAKIPEVLQILSTTGIMHEIYVILEHKRVSH